MEKFKREELYELIWSKPRTKISDKYNVKTSDITRICVKYNIPLPSSGHWMKKNPVRTPLPAYDKAYEYIELKPLELPKSKNDVISKIDIIVSEKLSNPDPMVYNASKDLKKKQKESYYRDGKNPIWTERGSASIHVTKNNIDRSLKIMDAFIKYFREKGYKISDGENGNIVTIGRIEMSFRIREKKRRVKKENPTSLWDQYDWFYSGLLVFSYNYSFDKREWVETETIPLEDKLPMIIKYYEKKAIENEIKQQKLEEGWRIQREERERQKALQERKDQEINKLLTLIENYNLWQHAENMRKFVSLLKSGSNNSTYDEEYIAWAKMKIDWIDPLISSRDELLGDEDREKIYKLLKILKEEKDLGFTHIQTGREKHYFSIINMGVLKPPKHPGGVCLW